MKFLVSALIIFAALGARAQEAQPIEPLNASSANTIELETSSQLHNSGGYWKRITCGSNDYRFRSCAVGGEIQSVRLVRQLSRFPCIANTNWGATPSYVWVSLGCRGVFDVFVRHRNDGGFPHPRGYDMTCSSHDGRRNYCTAPFWINHATVKRQLSSNACILGRSWGVYRNKIWVDHGCRAIFTVRR